MNKLTDLMWKDWHSEVRKAAAQTLGKAGHGKDVHDDLKDRLLNGNERERQDAVAKIGHLGMFVNYSVVTINRQVEQSVGLGRNSNQSTGEMDNRFFTIIACPLHMSTTKQSNNEVKLNRSYLLHHS